MIDEGFTHLLTFDSNLSFQQNFLRFRIPVIVIIAPSNDYGTIMEIFEGIIGKLSNAVVGANVVVHPATEKKK
jgi:hypothetical protein